MPWFPHGFDTSNMSNFLNLLMQNELRKQQQADEEAKTKSLMGNFLNASQVKTPVNLPMPIDTNGGMMPNPIATQVPNGFNMNTPQAFSALVPLVQHDPALGGFVTNWMKEQNPDLKVVGTPTGGLVQYDTKNPSGTIKSIMSPQAKPNDLPEGFAQIQDPKVKADTYNKTYGTKLTAEAFTVPEQYQPIIKSELDTNGNPKDYVAWFDKKNKKWTREEFGTPVNTKPKVAATTQSMIDAAPKVKDLINKMRDTITKNPEMMGVASSRYNEIMTGKVGTPNKDWAALRTNGGLLSTLLMRMHVGARGSEKIMEHFKDMIGYGHQSQENELEILNQLEDYANDVMNMGGNKVPPPKEDKRKKIEY
jgi:hypothetical protein